MNHLEPLQNAANAVKLQGLTVVEMYQQDKRKTVPKFLLTYNGTSVSPVLDYDKMNYFILGFIRAKEIL